MLKIEVEITRPGHRYDILFEPGLGANWRGEVADRVPAENYIVLLDANLARLQGHPASGTTTGQWNYLWVEPGERNKNLGQYQRLCEQATQFGIDRNTVLVAFGGGIAGDIAGFMASTLLRGLRLVQIPTTLLSQVDSSVGGKNGVNTPSGKNLVGTFWQPDLVLIDPVFLATLPRSEYASGLAEVVKTAILDGMDFFRQLQRSTDLLLSMNHGFMAGIIAHCCRFKTMVVAADEKEEGRRRSLNLGHTFAHALEALAGYDERLTHGQAVAVGIMLAGEFSLRRGVLPAQQLEEMRALLKALGLPVTIRQLGGEGNIDWSALLEMEGLVKALSSDKKTDKGKVTLVLPYAIGDCRVEMGYSAREVANFMLSCLDS